MNTRKDPQTGNGTVAAPRLPQLPRILSRWLDEWSEYVELEQCLIEGADFTAISRLETEGCIMSGIVLTAAVLEKFHCSDTEVTHLEAAGLRSPSVVWLRLTATNCRMSGADMGAAQLEDCLFDSVKLDDGGLRFANFKRVTFKNCDLRRADFTGAKLTHVVFSNLPTQFPERKLVGCRSSPHLSASGLQ